MPNILKEVRVLSQEGKLHQRLVTRVRMLLLISLALALVVIFNAAEREVALLLIAALAIGGFLMGMFVFSRMSPIEWNEEKEVVQAGAIGALGWITIALYIAFEIGVRTALKDFLPVSSTAYILATIFGVIFGRAVGMIVEIHRVYRATHVN